MALDHAILVSLLEQPGSGYELARRFDRSIGYFWTAAHQQIYRVLRRMERDGWLSVREIAQDGRPDKKEYSVAGPGRAVLAGWLREPIEPETVRHDLAVKIRGAAFDDPSALVPEIERHRRLHAERLARYLHGERRDFPGGADADAGPGARSAREALQHVVLRGGIELERMTLAWLDDVLATLHRLSPGGGATSIHPPEESPLMADPLLFNPRTFDDHGAGGPGRFGRFDEETRRILRATVDWFESRGKKALIDAYVDREWYADFLDFIAKEGIFAALLTPESEAGGKPGRRWDTSRIAAFSELLGFYGLNYWYTWQVTILGLGPVWQSGNAEARARAARLLDEGHVFAFGLSEKTHGADIYSTDMVLTPDGEGGFRANGAKYYIGNGNVAGMVSVFGRRADVDGPDGYVFFAADSRHPAYRLVGNVINSQMFVSEFHLDDYPVRAEDVLHTGQAAFDAALNTVNVGKFNLCFASIGICEHAMYEAVTHARGRILYGRGVTDFPHVRRELADAYVRLVAMKLFSDRAVDYFRSAGPDDRRYLLFNPMTKMKVTTEGEKVIDLMWDVIAAKGFEKDTYFDKAARDIRGLPKLEGTVHVNLALILKFMGNYLLQPADHPPVPTRDDPADDTFLFRQGPARGLSSIRFQDWTAAYDRYADVPNVARFREQAEGLRTLISTAAPDEEQKKDLDFLLALGQLFALVVYGQLILEQAAITSLDHDVLDEMFDVFVRDFSAHATELHGKASSTSAQQDWALAHLRKPVVDPARSARVWSRVEALSGSYEMRP